MTCICLGNVHTKFSCELIVKRETSLVEKFECDAEKTAHMKYPYHGCTSNTTISVNFVVSIECGKKSVLWRKRLKNLLHKI